MRGDTVVMFWSKYDSELDTNFEDWRSRPIGLNPSHILSLQSHLKFGHDIHLYSYQPIPNGIPDGVTVQDANEVYKADLAWSALTRGHSIAHISDIVRLRKAALSNGLVIDLDNIIVNELPNLFGFFSSIPAKATGGVAPKWGNAHPPFLVHDGSWDGKALSNFPTKVSQSMARDILGLANRIEITLSSLPKKDSKAWNFVMWGLKDISRDLPDIKVFPPIKAGPVPGWLAPGKCYTIESPTRLTGNETVFGYRLPSIEEILDQSYIVQHWFESSAQGVKQTTNPATFWFDMPADSLIGRIAEKTVGKNWKTLLPALARKESANGTL